MAITPKSKCWWTKELMQMCKQVNSTGRQSFACCNEPEHAVHIQHKAEKKRYVGNLKYNKKQHWRDWLEKVDEPDIWTANCYITAPDTDGSKARIPVLKVTVDREEMIVRTNSEKSATLAKGFFPPKLVVSSVQPNTKYPPQCQADVRITTDQLRKQFRKPKPYKAPGPDSIPNIVLMKCAELLTDSLLTIYEAMFECLLIYKPWKTFTMVVLRKLGKPRYNTPKAYRPIALLNTMWKVLTAVVADQLTFAMERHQLLPANHFRGRPGHTTTDAMHLLANTIKASWRVGKVTSALFLDIEGVFPNAVPSRLEHNLCMQRIPSKIIEFVHKMLKGRVTTLKFDGYTSEPISIDNGIGQGNPLSMGLYQYYNADLIEVPKDLGESVMAYVDDSVMIAIMDSFLEAHRKLLSMMTRDGGVADWSSLHNSPLKYSKLTLVDFTHSRSLKSRPPLHLPQITVQPMESTKYLGVVFDQNLSWKLQHAHVIGKGTKWAMQIRRLAKPSWGLTPGNARWLYISVAIPRIMYVIDVWCALPYANRQRQRGTVGITGKVVTMQRAGTLVITGGLRTSPTDALDAATYLIPVLLLVDKVCH